MHPMTNPMSKNCMTLKILTIDNLIFQLAIAFHSHSCPICQKYFSAKKKVQLHIKRVHKQIKDHNCDECQYKAHTKWDILRHIKTNHMPPDPDPKDFRICPDCGKVLKVIKVINYFPYLSKRFYISGQQSSQLPHQNQTFKADKVFMWLVRFQVVRKIRNPVTHRDTSFTSRWVISALSR